jgi:heat shock protein HtpX
MTSPPYEHPGANKRRAYGLIAATAAIIAVPLVVVAAVVGFVVGAPVAFALGGLLVGLVAAAAIVIPAWRQAEERILGLVAVRPADPVGHARLFNVVDGLCAAAGLPRPRLFTLAQEAPNAFTLGRDPRHGCVVVTDGLLSKLTRIELEGVVAHELSHLRAGDTLPPTLALALCGRRAAGSLASTATRLVLAVSDPRREEVADVAGVSLTRYPPGLIAALERIRGDAGRVVGVPEATAPLWLGPLDSGHLDSAHEDAGERRVDARIGALREL